MAKAVSTSIESKASVSHFPKRLSARLGALARAGFFVSEVVFELLEEENRADAAAPSVDKPLRNLVLTPGLVELARSLTTDRLRSLTGALDAKAFFEANPLKLCVDGAIRCLALEDEDDGVELEEEEEPVVGSPERREGASEVSNLPMLADTHGPALPALSRGDSSRVFGADQLAEIKLVLATSTSSDAKVEAVRKLWLSPLSADEKAVLFLLALRDQSRAVRSEAARGLATLGLDARVAENLAVACSGSDAERMVAVSNLAYMMPSAGEREVTLTVAVLTGLVDGLESTKLVAQALVLLRELMPERVSAYHDLALDLHRRVQALLMVQRPDTLQPARRLYEAMLAAAPSETAAMIRGSLDEVSPRYLRSFYLSLLAGSQAQPTTDIAVIRMMVDALVEGDELDPSYYALESGVRTLGAAVLPTLRADFQRVGERRKIRLLAVFNDLQQAGSMNAEALAEVVRDVVTAFERGSQEIRRAVYESSLFRTGSLSADVRVSAARAMLADVHEHELEASREMVSGAVLQLGGPAWGPVTDAVINGTRDVTVETACDMLGLLVERWGGEQEVEAGVGEVLPRLLPLLDSGHYPARGALYRAIGRVAAHRAVPRELSSSVLELLLERAKAGSSTYDVIDGLGYLASGDSISEDDRMELCHILLGFLQLDLPKLSGRIRQVAEELVLEFGRETTAYTDLIPRLLGAFERVIARENVSKALWRHIVEVLSKLFGRVARYEMVWAPASTLALARMLGEAVRSPHADSRLREELTELLLLKANVTPVIQVLGRMCMSEQTPRMDVLSGEVCDRLCAMLETGEEMEPSERREVLRSLGGLLEREQIGEDQEYDRRARRRILDHLYAATKAKLSGAGDLLRAAAERGRLGQMERDELRGWLARSPVRGG